MPKILTTEEVANKLAEYNLILIGEYITSREKITVKCHCGKIFTIWPRTILRGYKLSCGCSTKKKPKVKSETLVGTQINEWNILDIAPEQEGRFGTYLICKCSCGEIKEVRGTTILTNRSLSCGHIQREKARIQGIEACGENNPSYNPLLTEEDRKGFRPFEIKKWKDEVHARDDNQCQVCFTRENIATHHLNSYRWDKENRFNVDNGVTICQSCHKEFHTKYGIKHNTKSQFVEFFINNFQFPIIYKEIKEQN